MVKNSSLGYKKLMSKGNINLYSRIKNNTSKKYREKQGEKSFPHLTTAEYTFFSNAQNRNTLQKGWHDRPQNFYLKLKNTLSFLLQTKWNETRNQ